MTAALLAPMTQLVCEYPRPHSEFVIYVDDRSWATRDVATAMRILVVRKTWSEVVGLKENTGKAHFYHRSAAGRRTLIKAGCDPKAVTDRIAVLGCSMRGRQRRGNDGKEAERLCKATGVVNRCRCLPLPPRRRLGFVARTALPCAAWGWAARAPTQQDCDKFRRAIAVMAAEPKAGSVHLRKLMRGHAVDLAFVAGADVCAMLWHWVRCHALPLAAWDETFGVVSVARAFLGATGWEEVGEATWTWRSRRLAWCFSLDATVEAQPW